MSESQGWHKADCSLCERKTWHYKPAGNAPAHCSAHSNWKPNTKHVIVGTVMQAQLVSVVPAPTERELRIANRLDRSMWKHAEQRQSTAVPLDEPVENLFPDKPEGVQLDVDKLYCNFCGAETDAINTLSERKAVIRKAFDAYKTEAGEVIVQEKVVTKTETVHACRKCVLEIRKPIVVRRV